MAEALDAPLDIFVVRKLGMPGQPEYAIGAIASGGVRVISEEIVRAYGIPQHMIDAIARAEQAELERREQAYRRGAAPTNLRGRIVILIDDGLATGSTMRAAVQAVRQHGPERAVVAMPVGAPSICEEARRSPSRPSAGGIATSRRQPTRKCVLSWNSMRPRRTPQENGHERRCRPASFGARRAGSSRCRTDSDRCST